MNGYLYIAYGEEHIMEALASLASLRKVTPSAHVTLVSNRRVDGFDRLIIKDSFRPKFAGKVDNLSEQYYDKTMYVDTDTYFCEDCSPLFELLDRYDLCAMPDPAEVILSSGFTYYNTGVLVYRKSSLTAVLFDLFKYYYNDDKLMKEVLKDHPAGRFRTDQPAFSMAERDVPVLKTYSLPSIYNVRYRFSISLNGSVKIIHGPSTDFKKLQDRMNYSLGNRIWKRDMA
jgi:hypothetical protein